MSKKVPKPSGENRLRAFALQKPITAFLVTVLPLSWITLTSFFFMNIPVEFGLLIVNYIGLLGMSLLITIWLKGGSGIKQLLSRILLWRVGVGYYLLALLLMPTLTLCIAILIGKLHIPQDKWVPMIAPYFISLLSGAIIINLWEETAWSGFVQKRLMLKKGILKGSLLTAPAFIAIHLPLLLQQHGISDLIISFAALAGLALFFRYLLGMVFADTGSILIVGLLHASFNSSGAIGGYNTQIASIAAAILATLLVALYRIARKKSDTLQVAQVNPTS